MRCLLTLVSGILLLTLASCATTNQPGEGEESPATEAAEAPNQPSWYNALTASASDSTSFTGFAHAVSADRQEAQTLSEATAVKNLRFEIDRFAEEVRRQLVKDDANREFEQPAFIRELRNAVDSMPVDGAPSELEYFSDGSVVHAYTRIRISPQNVIDSLSARLNNRAFIASLRQRVSL